MMLIRQALLALLLSFSAVAMADNPIDINSADQSALMQIQGVGSARAEAIIDYREQYGPFMSVDELTEIQGIGQRTVDNNRDRLTVGSAE